MGDEDTAPAPIPVAKEVQKIDDSPKAVTQAELDAYCASQSRTSYSVMELASEDRAAIVARRG